MTETEESTHGGRRRAAGPREAEAEEANGNAGRRSGGIPRETAGARHGRFVRDR